MGSCLSHISFLRILIKCYPFPLVREGSTLSCAPSANAVAGNGWDGGQGQILCATPDLTLVPPSPIEGERVCSCWPSKRSLARCSRRLQWQSTTVACEGLL
jgi:hypothetical protein